MRAIQGTWPLVKERLAANWRLLAVLAFGMLVAAVLMAASPIYTRVMSDLGLEYALQERLRSSSRNTAIRFGLPLGTADASRVKLEIASLMNQGVGWLTEQEVRYGAVQRDLTHAIEGQPVPTGLYRTVLTLQTMSGLENHVNVVAGRLPAPNADPRQLEVALPFEAADFLGVRPGDAFLAAHVFDDCNRPPPTDDPEELRERARFRCVPQSFVTLRVPLVVVGIIEPRDPEDRYWSAGRLSFYRPAATDEGGAIVPVVLSEAGFYQALPRLIPAVPTEFRLTSFADIGRLNSANLSSTQEALRDLREELHARDALADLPMAAALDDFHRRASFNQVPLLLLLLQVVGISLYYVVLVSSMLVERRSEEIAMLRSRGASAGQVTLMALMEAATLGLLAALTAPFVAAGVVSLLGLTGTFASVSGGSPLPYVVLPVAFGYAAAGVVLAVIAVVLPTFLMARGTMVQFLHGAPGRASPSSSATTSTWALPAWPRLPSGS